MCVSEDELKKASKLNSYMAERSDKHQERMLDLSNDEAALRNYLQDAEESQKQAIEEVEVLEDDVNRSKEEANMLKVNEEKVRRNREELAQMDRQLIAANAKHCAEMQLEKKAQLHQLKLTRELNTQEEEARSETAAVRRTLRHEERELRSVKKSLEAGKAEADDRLQQVLQEADAHSEAAKANNDIMCRRTEAEEKLLAVQNKTNAMDMQRAYNCKSSCTIII